MDAPLAMLKQNKTVLLKAALYYATFLYMQKPPTDKRGTCFRFLMPETIRAILRILDDEDAACEIPMCGEVVQLLKIEQQTPRSQEVAAAVSPPRSWKKHVPFLAPLYAAAVALKLKDTDLFSTWQLDALTSALGTHTVLQTPEQPTLAQVLQRKPARHG